jgi:hypothetical protein
MVWDQILFLFRSFFPSWKFFEEFGELPKLFVRWGSNETQLGDWAQAFIPLERSWQSFFLNPEVNMRHLNETLLQQLKNESEKYLNSNDTIAFEGSSAFLITKSLALEFVQQQASSRTTPLPTKYFYQFKVSGVLPGNNQTPPDDFIYSPIFEAPV